jgi:dihydroxy-acid dehydratase
MIDRFKDVELPSRVLLSGRDRAAARAMLRAVGLSDADFEKPLIGIANTWTETTPCNSHLREVATWVKEGVRMGGGTPLEFNTIVVSDGITMGTEGMKTSLISREVVADSIELMARGYMFDGIIALSGCDKTIPGTVMAESPQPDAVRRVDHAGPLPRARRDDPGRLRGGRRGGGGADHRRGLARA